MNRSTRVVATVGLSIGLAAFGTISLAIGLFSGLQENAEDVLQPGIVTNEEVAVVAIDRESMAAAGVPWPWPRSLHAELLDSIGAQGPRLVVYDVIFADEKPEDPTFIASMNRVPTVLASSFTLAVDSEPPVVLDAVLPTPGLAQAAAGVGHANVSVYAGQGVVRELPFYAIDQRGIVQPSLVLAALSTQTESNQYVERPAGIQTGGLFVPLEGGDLRVNWAEHLITPDDVVSAADLLAGTADVPALDGKYVFVGVTEPTLGDTFLVPVDKTGSMPGVMIHANALNTVAQAAYLRPVGLGLQTVVILLVSIVSAVAYVRFPLKIAVSASAVLLIAIIVFATWRFHASGELWNIVVPAITVILGAIGGVSIRYVAEIRHRRRAASLFAQYVPAGTLDELVDPRRLERAAAGMRLEISVLFCDLRGFTPIAEELSPSQVRRLLDVYYDYAVTIIKEHNGTVMQFVGDEVFAVFGAPIGRVDDASRAIACAETLVAQVDRLDAALSDNNLPRIRFGIGLHRGFVVAAHVGSTDFRQYAVIGDTVNLGSRLCGRAESGQIVASSEAVSDQDRLRVEPLPDLALKGVESTIHAFRVDAEPM